MTNSSWKSSLGCATDEGTTVSWEEGSCLSVAASSGVASSTSVASHRLSSTAGCSAVCSAVSVAVCGLSVAVAWWPAGSVASWPSATINKAKLQRLRSAIEYLRLCAAIFLFRRWFTSALARHTRNQPMSCFHMDSYGTYMNLLFRKTKNYFYDILRVNCNVKALFIFYSSNYYQKYWHFNSF